MIYALGAIGLAGALLVDAIPKRIVPPLNEFGGDGVVDWLGAKAFWEGWSPFSPEGLKRAGIEKYGFGHPPTTPFWFLAFTNVDPRGLHQLSGHVVLILLLVQLILIATELRAPAPIATALFAFAMVVSQSWMQNHLQMVQLGEPIAFLLVLGWYFLRRDRQYAGGAMIGLSATLKLFPGLMFVFLAFSRRWRALTAASAAWLGVAAVMTYRYGGLTCWPQYFAQQPSIANFWMAHIRNGSLQGAVLRLWWPTCGYRGPVLPKAEALAAAAALVMLALMWRVARREMRLASTVDASYALFMTASVFFNPWIWEHYFVILILPVAVAISELWRAAHSGLGWWQTGLGAALLAAVLTMVNIDMNVKGGFNPRVGDQHLKMHLAELYNWLPWPLTMVLLGGLVYWFDRRRPLPAA
jgi:hypothetical protein